MPHVCGMANSAADSRRAAITVDRRPWRGLAGSRTKAKMTSQASAEPAASTRNPVRQELTSTTQASGVPVSSMPRPPIPSTSPETDANCAAGNWRAMNTVHTRKAGAQPMPISACPSTTRG